LERALVIALRPEKDHWLLLFTSILRVLGKYTVSQADENIMGWITNITKLILAHDVAGLFAIPGFKREALEALFKELGLDI